MTIKCQSFFNNLLYFCKRELSRFFKLKIVNYMKHGSFNFDTFGAMRIVLVVSFMLICLSAMAFNSCADKKDEPMTSNEHEYVDLGLPSGTLWATCNVGASNPDACGYYFSWGETSPKGSYKESNYKFGGYCQMAKYCIQSLFGYNGFTDDKTELDPEDDAAYVNWGPSWCMPTTEQLQELVDNCIWTLMTEYGVYGKQGTGPNGNVIFFPFEGYMVDDQVVIPDLFGCYWSRTLSSGRSDSADYLHIGSRGVSCCDQKRYLGLPVRAVRMIQN